MKPIMLVCAMMALFGLAGTAQAGPFGYNAGDEMPPIVGTNDDGLLWAAPNAPATFDELGVYGTEKTGVCAVSVFRMIEQGINNPDQVEVNVQQIQDILDRKYGSQCSLCTVFSDDMTWIIADTNNDIESITLSTSTMTGFDEYSGAIADHVVIRVDYTLSNFDECIAEVDLGL